MLFKSEDKVSMFADMMSEGFIVLDNKGIIQNYNKKAREIFGIVNNEQKRHKQSKIEVGDIVIIGDNSLGVDDGKLNSNKLESNGFTGKTTSSFAEQLLL